MSHLPDLSACSVGPDYVSRCHKLNNDRLYGHENIIVLPAPWMPAAVGWNPTTTISNHRFTAGLIPRWPTLGSKFQLPTRAPLSDRILLRLRMLTRAPWVSLCAMLLS